MVNIKIAFYKVDDNPYADITDKLIKWWTKGPYSHVEIILPSDLSFELRPKLKQLIHETIEDYVKKGLISKHWVIQRHISLSALGTFGAVRGKYHHINYTIWDYVDMEITEEQLKTILDFYMEIYGEKYDWFGILGFILPIQDRSDRWFCSETVANALKIIGDKRLWRLDPSNISPNKLAILLGKLDHLDKKSRFITFFTYLLRNIVKNN